MSDRPRLRFAPSPTGYLHVGGARTALFNWLFARRHGGVFVLRIEDTDVERSSDEMVTGTLESMRWLGLDWDEGPGVGGPHGPYFQSQRLARYRELAEQLVSTGAAYYCYCDPDEIKAKRDAAQARGEVWEYDRTCRNLASDDVARREAAGMRRAIRFKTPDGATAFDDIVQGRIEFDHAHLEDFVILRSDSHPTYHLSVVADDVDMRITHVVRGADHISNTPKQVLLYEALGAPVPEFAHVPLILGPDKRRLSKRHGATSVTEYSRQGYLPEAMMNFLALLGWSPGNDQEMFSREELIAAFSLEGISSSNAVFNPEKLEWFSAQHIARMPAADLVRRIEPLLCEAGLWPAAWGPAPSEGWSPGASPDALVGPWSPGSLDPGSWLARLVELLRPRAKRLTDFVEKGRPFLVEEVEYDAEAVKKHLSSPEALAHLAAVRDTCESAHAFTAAALEPAIRALAESRGVKAGVLIHPTRVAVVGRAESPGIFEVLELLGRDRALARMAHALQAFRTRS